MKKKIISAVVINYVSLIFMLVIFYAIQWLGLNKLFILVEIMLLLILITSFNSAFKKTGLWKLVHKPQKHLDERELQIIHKAIRHSYGIFVILCLVLIMLFAVAEGKPIDMVLASSLIYLAHTLPAAVIAFSEEEI
ncbi:MAG: hypothetical protein KAS53_05420 [Candidatus Cloacimonetes bacterium]|nr:hypothetical protein [Candidatus Cloacimonadota bacterium]